MALDSGNGGNGASGGTIIITYAANSALLASPLTNHFVSSLSHQLPLRTLHWRPGASTAESSNRSSSAAGRSNSGGLSTIRTIQALYVALRPLTDEIKRWRGDVGFFESLSSAGLLDRPFVHLYLVVCDDNDQYRTTVRNEIRSWISSLSFFHSKSAHANTSSASLSSAPSRNSLGLGSYRSSTPPVRSDTPGSSTPSGTPTGSRTSSLPASVSQDPEFIIVVIQPPEGSAIGAAAGSGPGPSSSESKSGMGRFYSKSKGNVVEKIKADFNTSKKEHVVHLTRLPPVPAQPNRAGAHTIDPTIWAELLTRMKESASTTFTTTVEAQEEEIRRCENGRGQPDWDFCSHFLAKDALAQTLEGVGLKEDAVAQYEDLETVFEQAMLGGNVVFAPIGGDAKDDDSLPLLDVTKKPYHELIRRREISLFDFRCYLFARRASLLGKLGRVVQVMREAPLFIGAVRRMLSSNPLVTRRMVESWAFSAALDVVEQCQAWLVERGDVPTSGRSRLEGRLAMAVTNSTSVEEQLSPVFHSAKADLLDLARRQLDKIGMAVGHLPTVEPFLLSIDDQSSNRRARDLPPLPSDAEAADEAQRAELQVTRPELQQAIESQDQFDSHYTILVDRIVAGLRSGGRNSSVLRMQTLLVALDYHRQRYDKAYAALVSLTESFHEQRWSSIEGHLLARQLECHRRLQKPRDRAWVSVVLAALRAGQGRPLLASDGLDLAQASESTVIQLWQDPRFLLQELRQAAAAFEREVPVGGNRAFSITPLTHRARLAETEDGSTIRVAVQSALGFELAVEDVRLCFTGARKESLWFTSGRTELQPGLSELTLFCSTPASGLFTLDVSQVRLAKLIFQYATVPPEAAGPSTSQPAPEGFLLSIPEDGGAIDADLDLPNVIHLDQPREVELRLDSGRNWIEHADISIIAADGEPIVDLTQAKLDFDRDPSSVTLGESPPNEAAGGRLNQSIRLLGQAAQSTSRIRMPLLVTSADGKIDAVVVVQYVARLQEGSRTNGRRTLRKHVQLNLSLPLGVNLQDYFRQASLFSKFIVSTGGTDSLRLKSARLAPDRDAKSFHGDAGGNELEVADCGSISETTVTPRQPASFLFRIRRRSRDNLAGHGDELAGNGRKLRLHLEYRSLVDEARATVVDALSRQISALGPAGKTLSAGSSVRTLLERALQNYIAIKLDLAAFSVTGEIRTGPFDIAWWRREKAAWDDTQGRQLLDEAVRLAAATLSFVSREGPGTDAAAGADGALHAGNAGVDPSSFKRGGWRLLSIPVDVPHMGVVNAVTLRLDRPQPSSSIPAAASISLPAPHEPSPGYQATIVVGHPVNLLVTVRTSFQWSDFGSAASDATHPSSAKRREQRFLYDVAADFENWLVSGMKRSTFSVPIPDAQMDGSAPGYGAETDGGNEHTFRIQLVPLRVGALTLPNVMVRPVGPALKQTPRSPVDVAAAHAESESEARARAEEEAALAAPLPSCETYVTNAAERIEVVPRRWKTRFGSNDGEPDRRGFEAASVRQRWSQRAEAAAYV